MSSTMNKKQICHEEPLKLRYYLIGLRDASGRLHPLGASTQPLSEWPKQSHVLWAWLFTGSVYQIWYGGNGGYKKRLGYATSPYGGDTDGDLFGDEACGGGDCDDSD